MVRNSDYELVVPENEWRSALRALVANPDGWGAGRVIREPGRASVGLLATDLVAHGHPRSGADFLPLSSWVAVAAPTGDAPAAPDEWLARLRPRFGQTLVIVLVGLGPDRAGWRGWVCANDRVVPLGGVRIVGPSMLRVSRSALPDFDDDPARWSRLRGAVGERVFAKLRAAEVALVGCSRTGTQAATMLAALGVGQLTLIDGDAIEPHNLDGMFHATPDDIGANKAVALARRLVAHRPDLAARAVPHALDAAHPEPAPQHLDLVVTCVDQDGPRLRVAHWCRDHLTAHLDIGTGVTRTASGERLLAADVRLLLPGAGCVRCVGGMSDLDQAEYEFYAPPGALPRRPTEPWNVGGRLGSLVTLNGLAVSAGIQSWLDLLEGTLSSSVWHRLRWRPESGMEANSGLVAAATDCLVCLPERRSGGLR